MKNTPIERKCDRRNDQDFQIATLPKATIREVKAIASKAEATSGVEFIKMEMGVPGLPASAVGVKGGNRSIAERNCKSVSRHQRTAGTEKRSVQLYQGIYQCRFKSAKVVCPSPVLCREHSLHS